MDTGIVLIAAAIGAFLLAFVMIVFSVRYIVRNTMEPRLRNFVEDAAVYTTVWTPAVDIRTRELSGSITTRVLVPLFRGIGNALGRLTPSRSLDDLRAKLYIAETPLMLGPREFYGLRFVFAVVGVLAAYVLVQRRTDTMGILAAVLIGVLGVLFPVLWLRLMVSKAQNNIRKELPDALDMLSVCADAGLGFDQSMQRVSDHWNTRLSNEFGRSVQEMEMGLSRREAMRNMAQRLDVMELSSFIAVILQSEQLGMSIAQTLHSQADQMRMERFYRAKEASQKVPIKMLIPLAFCIFPAIMAVLMGPSIPPIVELFANLGGG